MKITTSITEKYFEIMKQAVPGITSEDLQVPINESGIHSLDTIVLRDALENHFGFEIPDKDWYNFNTLSETLNYITDRDSAFGTEPGTDSPTALQRSHELRMPQRANAALSENWLLKEMGDMHWEMLSCGLEQRSSDFSDNIGNRLYAAFARINYSISPLDHFAENDTMQLSGDIKRFGDHTYYSAIKGECNDLRLSARLMTSFSARKANDNTQVYSCKSLKMEVNNIAELPSVPGFYSEHRSIKKGVADNITTGGYQFNLSDKVIESITHTINPYYEINGVGLLYFAAFPLIADECVSSFLKTTMAMADYDRSYHTTYRDVFYFANCNADDRIKADLNSVEHLDGNRLKMSVSLYRESDGKLMAMIMTVKQKTTE